MVVSSSELGTQDGEQKKMCEALFTFEPPQGTHDRWGSGGSCVCRLEFRRLRKEAGIGVPLVDT